MIIKHADSKDQQLELLESLKGSVPLDIKKRIEQEVRILKAGIKGEKDSAYLIDFHFNETKNWTVIHDLRLEINGRVAQIDHCLINRMLQCYVLETKHFQSGIKITDEGEFLRWNDFHKRFEGIPSPLAQNERHIAVLKDAFSQINMPKRMGISMKPSFHSLVLVAPTARIDRPNKFDTSQVIKADVLYDRLMKDDLGIAGSLGAVAKIVSQETILDIGQQLVALHTPLNPNWKAKFGLADSESVREAAAESTASQFQCRHCQSQKLSVQYGKFGYYFKCSSCDGNTPIKLVECVPGHKQKIRKDGSRFYRECAECGFSENFFVNAEC